MHYLALVYAAQIAASKWQRKQAAAPPPTRQTTSASRGRCTSITWPGSVVPLIDRSWYGRDAGAVPGCS